MLEKKWNEIKIKMWKFSLKYLHLPKKYLKYQRVWCSGFSNMGALGEPNTCYKKIKKQQKMNKRLEFKKKYINLIYNKMKKDI